MLSLLQTTINEALSAPEPSGPARRTEYRRRLEALQKLTTEAWADTEAELWKRVLAEHCLAEAALGQLPGYKKMAKGNDLFAELRRIEQALLPKRPKEPLAEPYPSEPVFPNRIQRLLDIEPSEWPVPTDLEPCLLEMERLLASENLPAPASRLDLSGDAPYFLPASAYTETFSFRFDLLSYYYWAAVAPPRCVQAWGNALEWQPPRVSLFDDDLQPNVLGLERLWALRPDEVWCNLTCGWFLGSVRCPLLRRQARERFGTKRGCLYSAPWLRLLRLHAQGARLLLLLPRPLFEAAEYAPLRLALQNQAQSIRLFDMGKALLCWVH